MTSSARTAPPHPVTDLHLARRLERTEAVANAAFVESRAALEPQSGAQWVEIAGVYAMFDGSASPLTQTFGLGLFEEIGDAEFTRLEAFFGARGAPVHHEVSPLIPPRLLSSLTARGYQPIELSSVLVRAIGPVDAAPDEAVSARRAEREDDIDRWTRTAAAGWSTEGPGLEDFMLGIGRIIGRARGTHCFLAYRKGEPIAAATLVLHEDVALLAGASTVPSGRRQGAQGALLRARLEFARAHSARIAMMVAQPGSGSHRNAERQGFRVAYTRTKWRLVDDGPYRR